MLLYFKWWGLNGVKGKEKPYAQCEKGAANAYAERKGIEIAQGKR